MRARRGFSLLEVLVSMGLFLMIIGLVAALMRGYAQITNASDSHEASLEAARLAVDSLRNDIEAAVVLQDPAFASVTPQARLSLLRIDAEQVRLPLVMPDPAPADWDPYDPATTVEVVYEVEGETLWRTSSWDDGTARRTRIGHGLPGFSVSSLADESIVISLTTKNLGGDEQVLQARAMMRSRSQW